jgi:hypothetical protein
MYTQPVSLAHRLRALGLRALAVGTTVSTLSGCFSSVFSCSEDAHCSQGDLLGMCQSEGYCSFPDASCESGQRFGEHARRGLAGECVMPDGTAETSTTALDSTSGDSTSGGSEAGSASEFSTSEAESSTGAGCLDWWDCGWSRRRRLDISVGPASQEALTDVPVLVLLTSQRIDYDMAAPDGADLRFVGDDAFSPLAYEIEHWEPGGTSVVWVKVPSIAPGRGVDHVYMYYGSAGAAAGAQPNEVWSNGYLAVWHLADTEDALGNFPLESVGSRPTQGQIGGARLFDGASTRMLVSGEDPLVELFEDGATVSAWIHASGWGGSNFGRIIESCSTSQAQEGWSFSVASPAESAETLRFAHDFENGPTEWRTEEYSIALEQWHFVAVSYVAVESATPSLIIDGATLPFSIAISSSGAPVTTSAHPTTIGAHAPADNRHFDGIIDELRVSSVARSEAWIELQHRSMTDDLLVYGDEETAPGA